MIEGYNITEKRIVIIKKDDQSIKLEISPDFIITKDWVDVQFENKDLAKCFNWLKNKGFVLENGKWNLYKSDKVHYIKLPQYFFNEEHGKLNVEFGRVEAKNFYLPRPNRGYCSLVGFPIYLPSNCYITMNNCIYNDIWIDFTSIEAYIEYMKLGRDGSDLDSFYFGECFNRLKEVPSTLNRYNVEYATYVKNLNSVISFFKFNEKTLLQNKVYVNLKRSLEVVSKYKL